MEGVFNSINDVCNLEFINYHQTEDGLDYFYLMELSSLQVLRELSINTPVQVTEVFSQRHRIAKREEVIKAANTVGELFDIVLPLVENGNFPCDTFNLIIDNETKLESHDDGEVHISSSKTAYLHELILKVFTRQQYSHSLLTKIINQPNLYHKIERPDKIVISYKTFEAVIDAM